MTSGTYSDSRRFFQYEIKSLFSPLLKMSMIGAEDMQLLFRICVFIKPSVMYRLSDH